jgi:hypothetical protein
MTDELLIQFRSSIPFADEDTAHRIYSRATSGRRRLPRRRLVLAIAAVAAAGGIVGGISATLDGGSGKTSVGVPGGGRNLVYRYQSEQFSGSGHSVTSIGMTIRASIADATLQVQVFRSDTLQQPPPSPDNAGSRLVFQEQVPMTNLASAEPDGTLSTWSGTLSPSAWDGGCQNALYRIQTTVYPAGSSTEWGDGYTAWFQCSGPTLDPTHPFPN